MCVCNPTGHNLITLMICQMFKRIITINCTLKDFSVTTANIGLLVGYESSDHGKNETT